MTATGTLAVEDDLGDTVHRSMAPAAPAPAEAPAAAQPQADQRSRRGLVVGLVVGIVALVVLAVVLILNLGSDGDGDGDGEGASAPPAVTGGGDDPEPPTDNLGGLVPAVTELEGKAQGDKVVFTWTNPDPQDGDTYGWREPQALTEAHYQQVSEPAVTVPKAKGAETCVEVVVVRSGAFSIEPKAVCV